VTVSVSREIAAPPERLWALVTDLAEMGRWSPENTGGTWIGGATGPSLGARFRGTNRRGLHRWSTLAVVVQWEPTTSFAFDVSAVGFPVARWEYRFEATERGCRVTETFTDRRGRLIRMLGRPVSGVGDRAAHNRAGMETTLARLDEAAGSG
jgi:uncharacterized protein YndB with AHSA1/START domain